MTTLGEIGEVALVKHLLDILGVGRGPEDDGAVVAVGPGDDAAILRTAGDVVLSTDSQHEAVHFRHDWIEPIALGRRVIAVNASDIGAMGATPRGFLVALALPPQTELGWAEQLARGLQEGAARFDAVILGGDVARVPERVGINVTAVGELDAGTDAVCRDGAVPASRCLVTGNPGRAAAGRDLLDAGYRLQDGRVESPGSGDESSAPETVAAIRACIGAYVDPAPPTAFGAAAAARGLVEAMIDVSDGTALDTWRICEASGIGATLDAEVLCDDAMLRTAAALTGSDIESWTLSGGDDYQLLCAVGAPHEAAFLSLAEQHGIAVRAIGEFTDVPGLRISRGGEPTPFEPAGWDHFS